MTFAGVAAVLGWLGALALLVGYWAVSTRRVRADGAVFQVVNVVGSGGLGIAAIAGRVWSAAVLNAVWVVIGVVILGRLTRQVSRRTEQRGQRRERGERQEQGQSRP